MSVFQVQEDRHIQAIGLIHRAHDVVAVVPVHIQHLRTIQQRQVGGIECSQHMLFALPEIGARSGLIGDVHFERSLDVRQEADFSLHAPFL